MAGIKGTTTGKKGGKVSVDISFSRSDILDGGTVSKLGEAIQEESVRMMNSGISPVTGKKFEKYKDPDKYPKNVRKHIPDKRNTPVNLKLSGNLHESFGWKRSGPFGFIFGLLNPKGKADKYGKVHNKDDLGRPDIPERKFLPTKPGETFNRTIMLKIQRLIVERIKKLTK